MQIRTVAYWAVVAFGVVCPNASGQPGSTGVVPSRDKLATMIEDDWPDVGELRVTYENQYGHWTRIGFDFPTQNWYIARSDPMQNYLMGRDSDGYFESSPIGKPLLEHPDWDQSRSSALDPFLPQIGLAQLLRDDTVKATITVDSETDGGLIVTVELPRGQRFPKVEDLPNAERDRWGVDGSVFRPAVYRLRKDLSIVSCTQPITEDRREPRTRTLEFGVHPEGPPGFQVNPEHGGMKVVECSVSSGKAPTRLARSAVLQAMTAARLKDGPSHRTPAYSAEYASEHPESAPAPIRGASRSSSGIPTAFIGAGALAVALGIGAWWRSRRS